MSNYNLNLNEPPEFGEVTFSFNIEPVSLQSKSTRKEFVKDQIRKVTRTLNYLLSGDVKVEIQWLLYEQERYESPNAPDMDNIIKPILDALSGPDGVLIDDCQVQAIGSHWIDWTKREHKINVSIRYIPEDFVSKTNLIFVNLGNNLFMPVQSDLPWKVKESLINHLEKGIILRNQSLFSTDNYYQAKLFMSTQRLFHKSRVFDNFKCIEMADFKIVIESEKQLSQKTVTDRLL